MMDAPQSLATSRLARLARRSAEPAPEPTERCGLCAAPVASAHRHLVDASKHELLCACRACATVFDRDEAGGDRYRLVPERVRRLDGFDLDDATWAALAVPVGIAFFLRRRATPGTVAVYPSPAGATEAAVPPGAWDALAARNPVLATIAPDVEALLVHRARGAREDWLVPIDACYRLVAVVRTHWKGLGGGARVWTAIDGFFAALAAGEGS
jgi:uncharacterized protein DUF5947